MSRGGVRHQAKELLSAGQLTAIREVRKRVSMAEVIARSLARLPLSTIVGIKQALEPIGRLDYANAQVQMSLSSKIEYGRLKSCAKEPDTVEWLNRVVARSEVFFDVGANVGAYSLLASAMKANLRIVAFEPSFSTFATLCRNVQLNRVSDRVTPVPIALSDATKLLAFQYRDIAAGAAEHAWTDAANRDRFAPAYTQTTIGYSLDEFIDKFKLPQPNAMKVDVDGAEGLLLDGARRTLRNPALFSVLIEVEDPEHDAVMKSLGSAGFRLRSTRRRPNSPNYANYVYER